jgi:hypothetical protein
VPAFPTILNPKGTKSKCATKRGQLSPVPQWQRAESCGLAKVEGWKVEKKNIP